MTKDARPLPPPRKSPEAESETDSDPATPRHPKRRRMEEVVASDTSSSFDPVSPSREEHDRDDTPRREVKKVKSCWEEEEADVPLQSLEPSEEEQRAMKMEAMVCSVFSWSVKLLTTFWTEPFTPSLTSNARGFTTKIS